ncbi:MAG: ISL3 family transposase, partial [Candidatus Tectomicrobia bacterium]|nr:ISL3 family transposase [Candidatus Tectomicrobia bacterium]
MRLRHLPRFDGPVLLEIRPKRYRCPFWAGAPTTTPRGAGYEPRSPNTKACEPWAVRMVITSTSTDPARTLGGSEEIIEGR